MVVKGCVYLPLGFASTITLLHTIRMQQNNFIQPNHILNTKVVLTSVVGQILIATIIYAFEQFEYLGITHDIAIILINLVMIVVKSSFVIAIALSHNNVRAHFSNILPISCFTSLWSLRQVRQINVNQRDVELHGVKIIRDS